MRVQPGKEGRGRVNSDFGRAVFAQGAPGELPEIMSAQVATGSNLRGSAAYRKHLIRVLVRRAVDELEGGAK